jgi:hypothetical protein
MTGEIIRCDGCRERFTKQAPEWDQWVWAARHGWRKVGTNYEATVCPTCFATKDLTLFN